MFISLSHLNAPIFFSQERLQFYIVVYDSYAPGGITVEPFAIDRFLINLTLGPVPAAIPRQTYHGIYNIAQFDLSFSVACTDSNHRGAVASAGKDHTHLNIA